MKKSQQLLASGLFVIFTISLFTLFIGYAQWWDGQQDLLFKIGWSGMVFIFLSLFCVSAFSLIVFVLQHAKKRMSLHEPSDTEAVNRSRRSFLMQSVPGGLTLLCAGYAGKGFLNWNLFPAAREVVLRIKRLPLDLDGFRIVQLADMHVDGYTSVDWVKEIVGQANSLAPDLIAMTGDLVDAPVHEISETVAPLAELSATYGNYFVTGNHEYGFFVQGVEQWIRHLQHLGFDVLLNEHRILTRGQGTLLVGGVTDYDAALSVSAHASQPSVAIKNAPPVDVSILMAHQPKSVYQAAKAGFDLQLSGHTHGGQIFPGQIMMALTQPFVSGLHRYGPTQIYVSAGAGHWGPKIRLGSTAEITAIVLTAG